VDNGLLRKDEAISVMQVCKKLSIPLEVINAQDTFITALKEVIDPEEKRKIIGRLFVEVFQASITITDSKGPVLPTNKRSVYYLAQGTIYPDVVESAQASHSEGVKGSQHVIKSHHNVGGLCQTLMNRTDQKWRLLEPLRFFFKEEVRAIGTAIGLPDEVVNRHPFPGPGLAIRMPHEVTEEKLNILREVDHLFMTFLKENGLYHQISQAYALLLPVKSVGVVGDKRRFDWVASLRAVCTGKNFILPHFSVTIRPSSIFAEYSANSRVHRRLYDGKPVSV